MLEALRDVVDPELGINVVDLGLVYGVDVDAERVATIDMTLTSAACPLTDVIEDQARDALEGLVADFRINWVWMPPWGPEKITEEGRGSSAPSASTSRPGCRTAPTRGRCVMKNPAAGGGRWVDVPARAPSVLDRHVHSPSRRIWRVVLPRNRSRRAWGRSRSASGSDAGCLCGRRPLSGGQQGEPRARLGRRWNGVPRTQTGRALPSLREPRRADRTSSRHVGRCVRGRSSSITHSPAREGTG